MTMTDATFIVASPVPLTVPGNGKVEIEGFVLIKDGGRVMSSMNGIFDFTTIPDEYHRQVINHLLRNRLSLTNWERPQTAESFPPAAGPSTPAAALATTHHRKPWRKFWSQ